MKIILLVLQCCLLASASILKLSRDHGYQRLSVQVTDLVPRHLCQETLNNLEVRNLQFCVIKVIMLFEATLFSGNHNAG